MGKLNQLLQYLHHLSIAVQHPTDNEDLNRLWNERQRVRGVIDSITRPALVIIIPPDAHARPSRRHPTRPLLFDKPLSCY